MIESRGHWLHSGGAAEFGEEQEIEIKVFLEHRTRDFIELERRANIRADLYSFTNLGRPGVDYTDLQVEHRLYEIWEEADDLSNIRDWVQDEDEDEDESMDSGDEEEENEQRDEEAMVCNNDVGHMDLARDGEEDSEDDDMDEDDGMGFLPRSARRNLMRLVRGMAERGGFEEDPNPDKHGPYAGVVRGLYGSANALPIKLWRPGLIPVCRPMDHGDREDSFVLR